MRKRVHFSLLVGVQINTTSMANRREVPRNSKNRTMTWASSSTSGQTPRKAINCWRDVFTPVFTAAVFNLDIHQQTEDENVEHIEKVLFSAGKKNKICWPVVVYVFNPSIQEQRQEDLWGWSQPGLQGEFCDNQATQSNPVSKSHPPKRNLIENYEFGKYTIKLSDPNSERKKPKHIFPPMRVLTCNVYMNICTQA